MPYGADKPVPAPGNPPSARIVFKPVPPGSELAAEIEQDRQQLLARRRAERSEMIKRCLGDTVTRLGIDLNNIAEGPFSWSASGGGSAAFTCIWTEGKVFNRLSMSHLKGQQIVALERCHVSKPQSELIYKVRVLTPTAEIEKELAVPI